MANYSGTLQLSGGEVYFEFTDDNENLTEYEVYDKAWDIVMSDLNGAKMGGWLQS